MLVDLLHCIHVQLCKLGYVQFALYVHKLMRDKINKEGE